MGKIRKVFTFTMLGLFLAGGGVSVAGTFLGLEPGVSTKRDADKALGRPEREVVKGERYNYKPKNLDIRHISIRINKRTEVIEVMDIYPQKPFTKRKYKEWLGLNSAPKTAIDSNGHLIEHYVSQGITLHFTGSDDSAPVQFYSLVTPSSLEARVTPKSPPPIEATIPKESPAPQGEQDYVRMSKDAIKRKDWQGLKPIVEEGLRRYPNNDTLWFNRAFYYFYSKSEPQRVRLRETLRSARRAYELNPTSKHAAEIGWIHLELYKDYYLALSYFEEAEREHAPKNPALLYWMARCYEEIGDFRRAVAYYDRFLQVAPNDEEAPDARRRLAGLERR